MLALPLFTFVLASALIDAPPVKPSHIDRASTTTVTAEVMFVLLPPPAASCACAAQLTMNPAVARHALWTMQCSVDGTLSRRSSVTTSTASYRFSRN